MKNDGITNGVPDSAVQGDAEKRTAVCSDSAVQDKTGKATLGADGAAEDRGTFSDNSTVEKCGVFADKSPEEKRVALYLRQKKLLDGFLATGAITESQYDKSFGDLTRLMGMEAHAQDKT